MTTQPIATQPVWGPPQQQEPPIGGPKAKRRWLWPVISLVTLLVGIGIGIGSAGGSSKTSSGTAGAQQTVTVTETPAAAPAVTVTAAPKAVAVPAAKGFPIRDGDWRLDSVTVKNDGLGDFGGRARITYTGDDSTGGDNIFAITIFKGGKDIGVLEGSANTVLPGKTVTVDLISQDHFVSGPYTFEFQNNL